MPGFRAGDEVEFREIARDLYLISAPERGVHSYFLVGVRGNVLFDPPKRIPFFKEHAEFFDARGGIGLQALNHEGDASKACAFVHKTWGAPVCVNRWDLAAARKKTGLAIERGLENDEALDPRVQGVHLPGHSVGQTAYRLEVDGSAYLVCGHAIRPMPTRDRWTVGAHRLMAAAALTSLQKLRALEVDFLLPDTTRWGPPPPLPFGPAERAAITDSARAQVAKKHSLA